MDSGFGFNVWNITTNPTNLKEAQQNLKTVLNWKRLGYTERDGVSIDEHLKKIRHSIVELNPNEGWKEEKEKLDIHLAEGKLARLEKEAAEDTKKAKAKQEQDKKEIDWSKYGNLTGYHWANDAFLTDDMDLKSVWRTAFTRGKTSTFGPPEHRHARKWGKLCEQVGVWESDTGMHFTEIIDKFGVKKT